MTPLKILIVEDEMITAESIKDMLEDLGYEVQDIFIRAEKALEAIEQEAPDIALFDIHLKGEKTGIWLAEQVRKSHNFPYIFLTSYGDKDTIEKASQTHPYGYLLKPIEKQHLFASIEVAIKKFAELNSHQNESEKEDSLVLKDSLFIKDEYLYVKIHFKDIQFIKSNGNYLEIQTESKKHMIKGTLGSFAESLPSQQFFQTHRSYILNLEKIEAVGGNYVKVGNVDVPITPPNKEELFNHIKRYQKT